LRYCLGLWDTAGQEEYDRLRPLSYPQTDLVIYVFHKNKKSTLDSLLSKWGPEIIHYIPTAHSVVVGVDLLKTDQVPGPLVDNGDIEEAVKAVHAEKYIDFAEPNELLISLVEIIENTL